MGPTLTDSRRSSRQISAPPGAVTIILVIAAITISLVACAVRLWRLDLQPYWVDETWSIGVAALPLADSLHTIKTEVHPPVYQLLLWLWLQIGGNHSGWTRLLSALVGVAGVFLSYWLLRRSGLPLTLRLLFVAASATTGMAIVYAQETRSYSLAWCAAVAVTATTLMMATTPREVPTRGVTVTWVAWGLIASSIHLFSTLLVLVAGLAIALRWRKRLGLLAALTLVAMSPQLAWLAFGKLFVAGFATASGWIPAPAIQDLAELATTVFAVDGLHYTHRGFAWSAPWGVIALASVVLALLAWSVASRMRSGVPSLAPAPHDAWYPASTLAVLGLGTIVIAWAASQIVHVWTVRNLIVVQPALAWCVISLIFALATRLRVATAAMMLVLVLLSVNLIFVVVNVSRPYKPAHELPPNVTNSTQGRPGTLDQPPV